MKIVTNQKKIDRNIKISKYTLYISLALLGLGFFWSIRNNEPEKSIVGWLILIPSYLLVQISIFLSNKWGKSPRPDEIVVQSLKGLKDDFTLYNFSTAVDHLLVGPIGLFVINPYHHIGTISYNAEKGVYKQKGGPGFIGKYFGQEALPNISRDVNTLKKDLANYFEHKSINLEIQPEIVNLFFGKDVEIEGADFPELTMRSDKLKDYIRKHADKNVLSIDEIKSLTKKIQKPA